jgi:hypothetical protein
VSDQENLEGRYRRLLAWYPLAFREENGEELIAVLMSGSTEGQRRPSLAASADLIGSGLVMRLRLSVPPSTRSVEAAVRLMYAGAAITTLSLVISMVSVDFLGRAADRLRILGHHQPLPAALSVGMVSGLAIIAIWLVMARAIGQGKSRARFVSTLLFGLATLHIFGNKGVPTLVFAFATWLLGLAALWLLWRPASREFFKSQQAARDEQRTQLSPR